MTDEQIAATHGYLPLTIAIAPKKRCSTLCNNITLILRSGSRTRPPKYRGVLQSWNAYWNANSKQITPPTSDASMLCDTVM